MSTDFNPTHRTNRAIGQIKAGSPIRVARYDGGGYFSDILTKLGETAYHLDFQYHGSHVQFWDPSAKETTSRCVLPGDYIITDGKHVEVSLTDSGWDLLTARKVSGTEDVDITFHETYYCLHGKESGTTLRMTPEDILALADRIKDFVPQPSPIENALYITAFHQTKGEYHVLAKLGGVWYDNNGIRHTEKQVLDNYDAFEVIV